MEERAALEKKYSDLCKPIYEERGSVIAGSFDDRIMRIHKVGGGKKEEEAGSKGDNGDKDNAGEGEEREGSTSLEDAFD